MAIDSKIRLATHRDVIRIAEMSRDYIEYGLGWRWTPTRVLRSVRSPTDNVIVACERERIVGFAIMEYRQEEAHLVLIAVEPSRRRFGIGAALIAWLEKTATTAGIGAIYLESRVHNAAARAFYRKLGYQELKVVAGWYRGREDGVLLGKDLWLHAGAHLADR